MSRESCIAHPSKQAIAIVRQDYYELTGRDACAAALLNIFEYWANAAIAADPSIERPWVGARPIREFEQMLLGIATDKQIRKRLVLLEQHGFIETTPPTKRGAAKTYRVLVPEIQAAISSQVADSGLPLGSNSLSFVGQMTEGMRSLGSNDQKGSGQITDESSVKQPKLRRSNDRALKKISKEFKKEDQEEKDPETLFSSSERAKPTAKLSKPKPVKTQTTVQTESERYEQPLENIDLADLWISNPQQARVQIKAIAPNHKRPEMVAHGFGRWWIGPGLNDFDKHLIQACRSRKRKLQQPDSESDAKTFINNMLRNEDWGNFSLRCEEAIALRERAAVTPIARIAEPMVSGRNSPFERSLEERRESALGLARFKVTQGQIEQALTISKQFSLSAAEIGIANRRPTDTYACAA